MTRSTLFLPVATPRCHAQSAGRPAGVPGRCGGRTPAADAGLDPGAKCGVGEGQRASLLLPDGAFLPVTNDGRARVLATSGKKPSPFNPNFAAFSDQGIRDIMVTEWFGIFAPAMRLPRP